MIESSITADGGRKHNHNGKGLPNTRNLEKLRERIKNNFYDSDIILSKVAERILIEII